MNKALVIGGVVAVLAAGAVMFVIPAETGWDPTGVGKATGLVEIASPKGEEAVRGEARMAAQEVLTLGETAPLPGASDEWEYELAPFESVEFKYTIAEGQPVAFRWEGSGPLHYDMHAHPFDGGEDLTESYGIGDSQLMQGRYTPAFSGIHGWFWQNRSMDTVTIRLTATGGMSLATIFSGNGAADREIEGALPLPEGAVEGHELQEPAPAAE
jgi:hypothetical protein